MFQNVKISRTTKIHQWFKSLQNLLSCDLFRGLTSTHLSEVHTINCIKHNTYIMRYFFLLLINIMVLFPIIKSTNWKKYQYGTLFQGQRSILHLVLFPTGIFSQYSTRILYQEGTTVSIHCSCLNFASQLTGDFQSTGIFLILANQKTVFFFN